MNQQDVFLVHMRELYARKIHKDPVWRESLYNKPPDLSPEGDSRYNAESFVVDWQMECVEYEIVENNLTLSAKSDINRLNMERKQDETYSAGKFVYSHIFDW